MTDLALHWDPETVSADLLLMGGALATDDSLRTAILISLFTDARASEDAALPEGGDDLRGWWGDQFAREAAPDAGSAEDRNRIGSLLWLFSRSKTLPAVLSGARRAAEDALAWLVRDGIAARVSVEVERQDQRLAIGVVLDRPTGPARQRYDFVWEASA